MCIFVLTLPLFLSFIFLDTTYRHDRIVPSYRKLNNHYSSRCVDNSFLKEICVGEFPNKCYYVFFCIFFNSDVTLFNGTRLTFILIQISKPQGCCCWSRVKVTDLLYKTVVLCSLIFLLDVFQYFLMEPLDVGWSFLVASNRLVVIMCMLLLRVKVRDGNYVAFAIKFCVKLVVFQNIYDILEWTFWLGLIDCLSAIV